MSFPGKPYEVSPTGRSVSDGSALAAADLDRIGRGSHERRTSIGLGRRLPVAPEAPPALLGVDYASIELRLAAAVTLGRFERAMFGGDSEDLALLVAAARGRTPGPALVARPPGRPRGKSIAFGPWPGGQRDVKPDNVPAPEPFEITCGACGGKGWTQPSMVVGFHPQRCTHCKGSGRVTVR